MCPCNVWLRESSILYYSLLVEGNILGPLKGLINICWTNGWMNGQTDRWTGEWMKGFVSATGPVTQLWSRGTHFQVRGHWGEVQVPTCSPLRLPEKSGWLWKKGLWSTVGQLKTSNVCLWLFKNLTFIIHLHQKSTSNLCMIRIEETFLLSDSSMFLNQKFCWDVLCIRHRVRHRW